MERDWPTVHLNRQRCTLSVQFCPGAAPFCVKRKSFAEMSMVSLFRLLGFKGLSLLQIYIYMYISIRLKQM